MLNFFFSTKTSFEAFHLCNRFKNTHIVRAPKNTIAPEIKEEDHRVQ